MDSVKFYALFICYFSCLFEYSCGLENDLKEPSVKWFQTCSSTSDRLTFQKPLDLASTNQKNVKYEITIHMDSTYQSILGFGGALTQSSAYVYQQLPAKLQREIMEAYYSPTGLDYTTGRLPIHSCDFSVDVYTFDEVAGDKDLEYFDDSVKYDKNLSLPFIHDALKINPDLLLFGSPWSPPAWMKTNNEMCCGGSLLEEYQSTWANYISRWITAYQNQGVKIWGVTVQNEPEAAQTWESCQYTPTSTRDFVAQHLGPVLKESHPGVKLLGYDHNKDHIETWADTLLMGNSSSAPYMDGIAFHWYSGSCFDNVKSVSNNYPDAILLPSEACYELTVLEDDEGEDSWLVNGTWSKGEGYGFDILGDLESGSVGWTDWNILLDSEGGPNHVDNFCDAPIIADVKQDPENIKIYYHPQYYYLGHFSKFLRPGSVRAQTSVKGGTAEKNECSWPYGGCDGDTLHVTSWKVKEDELVVVMMNCGEEEKDFSLLIPGAVEGALYNFVPPHAIQTYIFNI